MTGYTDVFVIPVPKQKTADYKKMAELSARTASSSPWGSSRTARAPTATR